MPQALLLLLAASLTRPCFAFLHRVAASVFLPDLRKVLPNEEEEVVVTKRCCGFCMPDMFKFKTFFCDCERPSMIVILFIVDTGLYLDLFKVDFFGGFCSNFDICC